MRGWDVTRNGSHVAVFLGDYFARGSKRSGAWCSAMRSQRKLGGEVRPIVVNVCNFAKADPALLADDQVTIAVQVNGKRRGEITVAKDLDAKAVEALALALDSVVRALDGRPVKKVIVVPGRIANIVG